MAERVLQAAAGCAFAGALFLLGATPAPIVPPASDGAPWTSDAVVRLDADLDAMLATASALKGAHAGVIALDTASGKVLYDHDGDGEFQPASTLKLVVGSVALDELRPDFRFRTTLGFAFEPGSSRAPALLLTASGDPTLSSADVRQAIAAVPAGPLAAAFVDDSAFDDNPYPAGWTWDDFAQDYAAAVSAATLDENVVTLVVTPAKKAGEEAHVRFEDGRPFGVLFDQECAPGVRNRVVVGRAYTGAATTDDTIDVVRTPDGCPKIVGSIPLGAAPETIAAAVPEPLVAMHDAIVRALPKGAVKWPVLDPALGIDVEKTYLRPPQSLVAQTPFWTHDSLPLSSLLGPRFWIPSDNLFAELLLKEVGLAALGKPGTADKGIATEKAWLQTIGVDPATVTLADGCGMSQYDRITPRDLVTILQHDWNGANRQLVLDSLPVGGARGTIEGIAGTPAAGRVFAKTGSMMHVRGLAGYLAPLHHGAVTFAFNVDDWNGDYPSLAALRAQVLARIVTDGS